MVQVLAWLAPYLICDAAAAVVVLSLVGKVVPVV